MIRYTILLFSISVLTGCHHLTLKGFDHADDTRVSGNTIALSMDNHTKNKNSSHVSLDNFYQGNGELKAIMGKSCNIKTDDGPEKIAAEVLPIITSLGKLVFDLVIDQKTREMEKLKKAAVNSYSQRLILSSNGFQKTSCVMIYRFDTKNNKIGFISVLKINKHGDGFSFTPIYVKANNTVSVTKKPKNDNEKAKINVSIAISLKAIGIEQNGLPSVHPIGQGVVSIPNLEISPKGMAKCIKGCSSSDLIPYLLQDEKSISVTLSVTETGKLGVDIDQKISEAEAIKEAMGPALKETLENYLKKDD